MGSGGTSWDTADVLTKVRLQQKTTFVGTGAEINAIVTTYAGQLAYCTLSGSGFTIDVFYKRDAANTSWSTLGSNQSPYLKLSTTIGDYTQPASAVASSEATITADALWGVSSNQIIENFTTYANTTEGDASYPTGDTARIRVNPTTDVLDISLSTSSINQTIYRDIGTANISETEWICRFKLNITTLTRSTSAASEAKIAFTLNSLHALGEAPVEDSLGICFYFSNNELVFKNLVSNGGVQTVSTVTSLVPTTTTYYIQMNRASATSFVVKIYSDSAYTTQVGDTNTATISSSYAGLRYFGIQLFTETTNGNVVATADDIQFWNLASTPTSVATRAVDNSTVSDWKSNSEANPRIYVDLSSDREIVGVALNINKTATTVTSLKIRASTDTSFSDAENIAYVSISDFTDDTWRYLANNFLAANTRYVQFYANETGVLAINEIKVRYGVTDLIKILTHRHMTRNVTLDDLMVDSN